MIRLDIESLRALKTVAELGGVTRAAASLALTQSAVSHKIKRLEDRVGRPLFRRAGGGVAPTADGAELLRYADRLLALHDEAAAQFARSDLAGTLRLGITEDTTAAGMARVLARFAKSHPNVTVHARVAQSVTLFDRLDRGEIDLAVAQTFQHEMRPQDRVLWRDELVWARSADFAVPDRGAIPFVSFDEQCFYRRWALAAFAGRDPSLKVVLDCPSMAGVCGAVRSGLGVAIVNRRNLAPGLRVAEIDAAPLPAIAYVVRAAGDAPGAPARALGTAIVDELADGA